MADRLTDRTLRAIAPPPNGNRIVYDEDVKGFGVRVTAAGAKAFVLNYRAGGRERRITIGSWPDWNVSAAREHAKGLKREVDAGGDPMGKRHTDRLAPSVNALAERFKTDHLSKRRASTAADYESLLRIYILPHLGAKRVEDVRHEDVERMHRTAATEAPYRANRAVAVLSKMMSLAIKWELRTDNPCIGIEREPELKRERFLSEEVEIPRLVAALAAVQSQTSANAIRLLLLTGARKSEVLKARWSEFDLAKGVWVKPSAHTKTKKDHRIPLSAPALMLLKEMRKAADKEVARGGSADFVLEGAAGKHLTSIKTTWTAVCKEAGLGSMVEAKNAGGKTRRVWRSDTRIHDLRHSYASILVSSGLSLPVIGALLGHTQAATTHRYAHLADDPLRAATERVGAVVAGTRQGENKKAKL